MTRKTLKNKPLVETIFELRWGLQKAAPGVNIDPHFKIIVGRMYDKLSSDYPFHEQLPTASIPDEMAGYVVQHRFRKGKAQWPLVQIGPGILTTNDTEGYVWEDFQQRVLLAVRALFEVYPESKDNLRVNNLLLRYINATPFDFDRDDVFEFLKHMMKTEIVLCRKLFEGTGAEKLPSGFDCRFAFRSSVPNGTVTLRFARGRKKESDVLIWETMVQSTSLEATNEIPDDIERWLTEAHSLTDDWFFKLIEGELLTRFE